ncbi:MAG: hypothetical protein F4Z26_10150 [Acidimicrobiaceae bacterium]|nr:hypothetical protein [Acidimicrobiaceae bacterium]
MPPAFRPRFRRGAAADETGEAGDELDSGEAGDDLSDAGGDHPGGGGVGDEAEDGASDDAGEWLAYDFHEWSLESRVMLEQLLTVDQVVHSWQGTTLMVHESLEATVDGLVEEVEETEEAKEAIARPIGPDEPLTAFELAEWPEALRSELMERLVQARVPHILDTGGDTGDPGAGDPGADDAEVAGVDAPESDAEPGPVCDLLVREADEERVEVVIDDLLAREEEADFEEMDGLEVNRLLSDLFMACDRLRRDPRDFDGLRGVLAHAPRVARVRTPFGFSAPSWRNLRNAAGDLLAMVEDEDSDAEDLRELAHRMSDTLRMLI